MLENSDERLGVRQPWGRRGQAVLPDDPQIGQVLRDRAEDAVQVARLLHIDIYRGHLGAASRAVCMAVRVEAARLKSTAAPAEPNNGNAASVSNGARLALLRDAEVGEIGPDLLERGRQRRRRGQHPELVRRAGAAL